MKRIWDVLLENRRDYYGLWILVINSTFSCNYISTNVLIFAFAMGDLVGELDTGQYLASLFSSFLKPALLPTLVFLISCIISFATGTSMGTMAVMMPLAMPMAFSMGANIPLIASAVFGGSIFGDHASPISDTTVMACSTSGCDVMDHINSQLPYTLIFAAISIILYIVAGMIM